MTTRKATVVWEGGLRSGKGSCKSDSGAINAVYTYGSRFDNNVGSNPEELLAAALANCYTSTITAHARAKKIEIARIETKARTRLSWDEKTPHHIARGDLTVRITTAEPEARVRQLADEAREHCPVCNVLGATADVTLAVTVLPAR